MRSEPTLPSLASSHQSDVEVSINCSLSSQIQVLRPQSQKALQEDLAAGRVLKGQKLADLPVMRAVKFEFIINPQKPNVRASDKPYRRGGSASSAAVVRTAALPLT
jgi:hypothetical protein